MQSIKNSTLFHPVILPHSSPVASEADLEREERDGR